MPRNNKEKIKIELQPRINIEAQKKNKRRKNDKQPKKRWNSGY